MDQLGRSGAAEQECQVHRDLEDRTSGSNGRVDSKIFGRFFDGGVSGAGISPANVTPKRSE